jgi:hypothetical protein
MSTLFEGKTFGEDGDNRIVNEFRKSRDCLVISQEDDVVGKEREN